LKRSCQGRFASGFFDRLCGLKKYRFSVMIQPLLLDLLSTSWASLSHASKGASVSRTFQGGH
jgi:hypothetical protein